MQLDPVLLEIMSNKVSAAADQMYVTPRRASRSTHVKEAADFGAERKALDAVFDDAIMRDDR